MIHLVIIDNFSVCCLLKHEGGTEKMGHYQSVPDGTGDSLSNAESKRLFSKPRINFHQLRSDLWAFFYTLILSIIPTLFLFIFFTGPKSGWDWLEFFQNYSLLYLSVTLSAVSIYTYHGSSEKKMKSILPLHIFTMLIGMMVYILKLTGVDVYLFHELDYRLFIGGFLMISIVLSIVTLTLSNKKGGIL